MNGNGVRVFVVEDEPLLRLELEDILADLGHDLAGSVGKLDEALALAATVDCDVAILDVNLGRERVDPVADLLKARLIPVLFTTGYGDAGRPINHPGAPLLEKPYQSAALSAALFGLMWR